MRHVTPPWQADPVLIAATPRLRIRDWELEDAPTVLDIHGRMEVMKWLGDGEVVLCRDLDHAREKIQRWQGRDDPPLGYWAIDVTDGGPLDGRCIGAVLLVPLPENEHGEVEIGWHLHPDAWGQAYAPEAAAAVLDRGFEGGLPEIHAVTHLTNDRSMSVCARIGMEHRGITHRWYDEPSQHYRITQAQWLARRQATTG